jgi:pimeloyl-ACP methyl ester carboxylesterase
MATLAVFTTSEGEAETLNSYQAVLDAWPVPFTELTVPTSFGETYVIASGPEGAPPVVLLHALLATATSWYRNVGPLSDSYRVYAVDIVGEGNHSRPSRPITSLDDFLAWFTELIDGLGIDTCYLVGNSYGGLTAAYYAMKLPERVKKLVLVGPAATIHRMLPFYRHMFIPKAVYLMVKGLPGAARVMRRSVDWMHDGLPRDPLWEPLFYRSMVYGNLTNQVFPRIYSKEEFDQIEAPVMLILGDHERIYSPDRAARAAEALIEGVEVEIVPGAHHIAALAQPEVVNRHLLRFFAA